MLKIAIISAVQIVSVQTAPSDKSYLILPDLKSALARSEQQCIALGCDGKLTKYWWNVIELKDGTAAVEIHPSGSFAQETRVEDQKGGPDKVAGLAPNEAAALVDAATIDPVLPKPDPPKPDPAPTPDPIPVPP